MLVTLLLNKFNTLHAVYNHLDLLCVSLSLTLLSLQCLLFKHVVVKVHLSEKLFYNTSTVSTVLSVEYG